MSDDNNFYNFGSDKPNAEEDKNTSSDFLSSEKENESGYTLNNETESTAEEPSAHETKDSNGQSEDVSPSAESSVNEQQPVTPNQQPYGWNQANNQNQYGNYNNNGNCYRQPYNPYAQNNQNNQYRQYGQYNNQYNQYGSYNPYGQNNSYGYNGQTNPGNPSNSPYTPNSDNTNGFQQPQMEPNFAPQPPKRKMNGGLKVFLFTIGTIAVLFVFGFCGYGIYETIHQSPLPQNSQSAPSSSSEQPESGNAQSGASSQGNNNSSQGSVTNPGSTGLIIKHQPTTNAMSAKDVFKRIAPSVVGVITTEQGVSGSSQGSGIIATADGYIITNAHVINYSKDYQIKVVLYDKKEYKGSVVGFDKTTDLAVIKINAAGLTAAEFGYAEDLSVGDSVLAIGNPGGIEFSSSLTGGLVSALNRSVGSSSSNGMTYIQTDAAINPGNSGGALVNMYGQVVGINSSKIVATGYEGMGFAIPISKAKSILDVLVTKGYVSGRSRLGITAQTVADAQVQAYGMPQGVMVQSIASDSSLKNSGIIQGDIITKADGKAISSMEDLYQILNAHKPGDTLKLTIYRAGEQTTQGKTFTVTAKLLEDKGETQSTK